MAFAMSASTACVAAVRPARVVAKSRKASSIPKGLGASASLGARRATFGTSRKTSTTRGLSMKVRAENDVSVTERVSTDSVMIDPVVGAKRFSNYFWAGVVTTGATGFLITGASAYFEHNLLWFLDASEIKFFPQGLVMSFYGVAGSLLATYLWLTINWDVGAGYNEFNKDEGIMRIFRYGFPGKNRRINLVSQLADVQAVRVEISDGVNPRRVVYVRCKGKSDIPLTRIGQPMTLAEVESQAADLAKFLGVPIEGL
jgi:hypothetical protein|tara:strand:+ start:3971 stop:4741 length:771 start_codon:yes stop_codon:yes gene_type:complete